MRQPKSTGSHLLMTTIESFSSGDGGPPSTSSTVVTGAFVVAVLLAIEMFLRYALKEFQHMHPLLEVEINRLVLARHLGCDTIGCMWVAYLGWRGRHVCNAMISRVLYKQNSMPDAGYESRMFTYEPHGFRVALVFFGYQTKNLYDTFAWNDGPEYVLHHFMAMLAASSGLIPCYAHFYSIFFLGISEISTGILCILANFDDAHGVLGLGDAFPRLKVLIGALFVIAFVVCRCVMWPIVSYYCARDCTLALNGTTEHAKTGRFMLHAIRSTLTGLSVLQVVFLVQIFITAHKEFLS